MQKIPIEISARHIHVCQKDLDVLFGRGYNLKPLRELSQKGQFASKERVGIKTRKGEFPQVRILGPVRKHTQVEISTTDARKLGIEPPVRMSGNIKGSLGIKIIGPKSKIKIKEGLIIARRHIHCGKRETKKYGVREGQKVSVKAEGDRSLTFHEIAVRVRSDFKWGMHVDTDEANAAGVGEEGVGEVIQTK